MKLANTKLFQLIHLLEPEEWSRFGKWLRSPWCNTNKKLWELYQVVDQFYPKLEHRKLSKERLFEQLYPANTYSVKWMRNLMSELSLSLERFLAHEHLNQSVDTQQKFVQEEFLARGRRDWFFKGTRKLTERLSSKEVKTGKDYLDLALLHEHIYRHVSATDRQQSDVVDFKAAQDNLDQFYILEKLRFWVEQKERKVITSDETHIGNAIEFLKFFPPEELSQEANYYIHFLKEDWSYAQFKENYFSNFESFNSKDQQIILLLLINKAVKNKIKGDNAYLKDIFNYYQFGLAHDLFLNKGKISSVSFANIVSVGNSLKAFAFVENFVENYANCLTKDLEEDAIDWAEAHMAYHQEQKALENLAFKLAQRRSNHSSFSIRTNVLLLQMRFDHFLKVREPDQFLIDFSLAFEKQLSRDKNFSGQRLLALKKFVQYTRRLYKLKVDLKLSKDSLDKLEKDLDQEENIRAKKWLLTKLETMQAQL